MTTPADALRALLDTVPIASLGVLVDGAPSVSLVPFVLRRGPVRFELFVSDLAAHTSALRADPRCSVLVHESHRDDDPREHHALARVTLAARARFVPRAAADLDGFADRYRAKFPALAAMLVPLGDFHVVELTPVDGTFVQGFGRAFAVTGPDLDVLTHQRAR